MNIRKMTILAVIILLALIQITVGTTSLAYTGFSYGPLSYLRSKKLGLKSKEVLHGQ